MPREPKFLDQRVWVFPDEPFQSKTEAKFLGYASALGPRVAERRPSRAQTNR